MTQVQFETSKANLLFVMLPEECRPYVQSINSLHQEFWCVKNGLSIRLCALPGRNVNWQTLGFVSSLTEEDMEKVCDKKRGCFRDYSGVNFVIYNCQFTVSKSFASLLTKAGVYLENPFGDCVPMVSELQSSIDYFEKWQTAQSRTSKYWFLLAEFKL